MKAKRCPDYLLSMEAMDCSLKKYLPLGLLILEAINYRSPSSWHRRIDFELAELYGGQNLAVFVQLHRALRLVYTLSGSLLSFLLLLIAPKIDQMLLLFVLVLLVILFFLPDYELHQKVKKRRLMLEVEFPDFLNKITLLLGAGMTVPRAWEKTVKENGKNTPLYRELRRSLADIQAGKAMFQAFEDFARRCRTPEINKFITLILQNMKKGNAELVFILRVQAGECWEMRKHAARRLGEEASTKMLFPLVLMLIAILLIVSAPAILALQVL